jgi:coenzyme F420-reducing hydrogenase delta subunit
MIIMGIKISKMKEIENLAKELMQLDLGDIKMMEYSKDELKEVSKSLRNLVNAIKRIK